MGNETTGAKQREGWSPLRYTRRSQELIKALQEQMQGSGSAQCLFPSRLTGSASALKPL